MNGFRYCTSDYPWFEPAFLCRYALIFCAARQQLTFYVKEEENYATLAQTKTCNVEFIFVHMWQDTKKYLKKVKISECNSVIIQTC
jgi:hypothetical protein